MTIESLINFFGTNGFIPHGYCLIWNSGLLWLHVLSDTLIVLAYYAIPIMLAIFVGKRKDLPYPWIFKLLGLFIVACGTTHLLAVITVWQPLYWLDGIAKAVTAGVSVATAVSMFWVMPRLLTLRKPAELQEALDRLTKIASQVPGVVFQFRLRPDGSTCMPYASEGLGDIFRVSPQEVGENASQLSAHIHPDDLDRLVASIQASANDLSHWIHECRLQFEGEPVRWLFGNASPQREADGSILWHGFITDNTERKIAEQKLRNLYVAVEQIPASVLITDLNANIEYVNEGFVKATGYSKAEVLGKNPRILQSGLTSDEIFHQLWDTITNGKVWQGEFLNRKKAGEIYWEDAHIAPVCNHQGLITHYVAVKLDITEQKKIQNALQESEKRFRTLANAAPVLIWISGADKLCSWFNQMWLDFTGRSLEQEIGSGWAEDVHPDDLAYCLSIYQSHFDQRKEFRMEYRLRRHDGEYRWLDDHGVPLLMIRAISAVISVPAPTLPTSKTLKRLFARARPNSPRYSKIVPSGLGLPNLPTADLSRLTMPFYSCLAIRGKR